MELRPILPGSPDTAAFDTLNTEAFPAEERMDTEFQFELAADGSIEILGIYDDSRFVGFTTVHCTDKLAYVFFLAISPLTRSKGYGARTLDLLRERYPQLCLVLDIEPVGTGAENEDMRLRRRGFYLRCGFVSAAHTLNYLGMSFEIMHDSRMPFSIALYNELLESIRASLTKKGINSFKPVVLPMQGQGNSCI